MPVKLLMRDDIISKDNITHLTDLKVPGLVASAYEKGLDGKLLFEHQRNVKHHMPAREDILESYNKGNDN